MGVSAGRGESCGRTDKLTKEELTNKCNAQKIPRQREKREKFYFFTLEKAKI